MRCCVLRIDLHLILMTEWVTNFGPNWNTCNSQRFFPPCCMCLYSRIFVMLSSLRKFELYILRPNVAATWCALLSLVQTCIGFQSDSCSIRWRSCEYSTVVHAQQIRAIPSKRLLVGHGTKVVHYLNWTRTIFSTQYTSRHSSNFDVLKCRYSVIGVQSTFFVVQPTKKDGCHRSDSHWWRSVIFSCGWCIVIPINVG